jgi:hypothetical protein
VHPRDGQAVPGDADEAHEAFLAGFDRGLQRAAFAQRELPLDHVDEVVQLDQVDVVDAEPLERAADLLARALVLTLPCFRRDEEPSGILRQPRCEPQLRITVRRGDVDVVDAVLEQELERRIRLGLRELSERSCSEDRAGALMASAAEWGGCDHASRLAPMRFDLIAVGDVPRRVKGR